MRQKLFHFHQERHSKPFLLLEIGMLQLRLHAVDAGRSPISITTLHEEILTPGDMHLLVETVKTVLDPESTIRDLAIVLNSPGIRHQVISIPVLGGAERQKVLQHEMKHSSAAGETPGVVSYWSAGKIKEQNSTKEFVLCAEMNRSIADNLIAAVQEKKFNLIGFTSYAQMVSRLLRQCRIDGAGNVALLEADHHEGSITLFHSNIWNMERHFLIGGSNIAFDSKEFPALDAEKVKLEVGRALQYFKQQVRNENINHIFLFGATNRAAAIKKILEASFRIPISLLTLEAKTFELKDPAGNQQDTAPLFGIAHAAALHAHFDKYISFLPREWRGEKHVKVRRGTLIAAAVVYYAFLGGLSYVLKHETAEIAAREENGSAESPLLLGRIAQPAQQLQISRSFALATQQSDEWLRARHSVMAELARELAGSAPLQMRITMLEVTEKGDAWQVKLQAEIRSPNGSRSQQLFLGFQEQMKHLACLRHLTWGEVRLADTESAKNADPDSPEPRARNLLTFTMQGMLGYTALPAKSQPTQPVDPMKS
jgi:hypothetical protein